MSTREAPSLQHRSESAWTKNQTEKKGKHCADTCEQQCRRQMAAASPMQQLQQLSAAQQRVKAHRSAKPRQLGQNISPRCTFKKVSPDLLQQPV
jgi:phage-related baseplate assembly protein